MLPTEMREKLRKASEPWPDIKPDLRASHSCWFHRDHREAFMGLMKLRRPQSYLELGTWTGRGSTRFVLDTFPKVDVIAVDTFEGSAEHHRRPEWRAIASRLWEHFCVNVWNERERIFPLRMTTEEGMGRLHDLGIQPDLIYVDAAHDRQSVYRDVAAALSLFPQAALMGDDYYPKGVSGAPGVREGLEKAEQEGLFSADELQHHCRVWYLTRNLERSS